MSKPSLVPFLLVVTIPVGFFLAAVAVVVVLSVAVWDQVQTQDFLSRIKLPFGDSSMSLANMRNMRIRNQALQYVNMLNSMEVGDGNPAANEYLRKLIDLSGEDFGTGYRGQGKFTPPQDAEKWAEVMQKVNSWSDENFGTDFSDGSFGYPGFTPPGVEEPDPNDNYQDNEPPPTYELPEDNESPSYSPKPVPEDQPDYNRHDYGSDVDPGYNREDGFQPEPD